MAPKAWLFVTVEGGAQAEENKRIVRQAAMQDYRRRERLNRIRKHKKTKDQKDHAQADADSCPGSEQDQAINDQDHSTLQSEIVCVSKCGFNFMDPFDSTALPRRKDAWSLFSHCKYLLPNVQY
jgi:hypothetical protein